MWNMILHLKVFSSKKKQRTAFSSIIVTLTKEIRQTNSSKWREKSGVNSKEFEAASGLFASRLRRHIGRADRYGFRNNNNGMSNDRNEKFLVDSSPFCFGFRGVDGFDIFGDGAVFNTQYFYQFFRNKLKVLLASNRFDISAAASFAPNEALSR